MSGNGPRWRWRGGPVIVPSHTHEMLIAHIERGENPFDDFFDALLSNDLKGAVQNADDMNLPALSNIVGWMHKYAPAECYGSSGKMQAWRAQGGLGIEDEIAKGGRA